MKALFAGLRASLTFDFKTVTLGSVIAIVIAWELTHTLWDVLWASILSWVYVAYKLSGMWAACGVLAFWVIRTWTLSSESLKKSETRKKVILALNHPDIQKVDPEPTRIAKPDGTRWADWEEFSFALRAWDRRQTLREMRVERLEAEAAAEAASDEDQP